MSGRLKKMIKKGRRAGVKYFQISPRNYEIDRLYLIVFKWLED